MKFESIPLTELILPDDGSIPELTAGDICRLLSTKVLRGRLICGIVFAASMIGFAYAWMEPGKIPWAAASILLGFLSAFGFYTANQKLDLARRISADPTLVYWAHPTVLRQRVGGATIDSTFITLHSRNARTFEVGMSRKEMLAVVSWLRDHNPEIRLGEN